MATALADVFILKASSWPVLLLLHLIFFEGNPRSQAGSGEDGTHALLPSWGLVLDVMMEGPVE
jgi:hypothetical protein